MKNILLTGGKGQLGQALQFIAADYPDFNFIVTDVEDLDITNREALFEWFDTQEGGIHGLVNCAAYVLADKAESDEERAYRLNLDATLYLAEVCKKHGAQLIHISTDYVFDGRNYRPYKEEDKPFGRGVYGSSKIQGEQAAIGHNDQTVVIRTAWLYSQFGVNFVKRMQELMNERPSLNVVFDQTGTPTYAVDLAHAILKTLQQKFATPDVNLGGIYHYSNEGVASWYDFAMAIKELINSSCDVRPVTTDQYLTPATRPPYSVLNKQKIKSTLGINIPYWRDSLKRCVQYLQPADVAAVAQ